MLTNRLVLNRHCHKDLLQLSINLKGKPKKLQTIWKIQPHSPLGTSYSKVMLQNQEGSLLSAVNLRYRSTTTTTNETKDKPVDSEKLLETEPKDLTRVEKLKKAVKEYGSTVIVFHVGISLSSLGTCYLLVSSGLDIAVVFDALGIQDWISKSALAANAGTFAVAYAVHKVFAPVRITITLACVPFIVRYLRKVGFLKK